LIVQKKNKGIKGGRLERQKKKKWKGDKTQRGIKGIATGLSPQYSREREAQKGDKE